MSYLYVIYFTLKILWNSVIEFCKSTSFRIRRIGDMSSTMWAHARTLFCVSPETRNSKKINRTQKHMNYIRIYNRYKLISNRLSELYGNWIARLCYNSRLKTSKKQIHADRKIRTEFLFLLRSGSIDAFKINIAKSFFLSTYSYLNCNVFRTEFAHRPRSKYWNALFVALVIRVLFGLQSIKMADV